MAITTLSSDADSDDDVCSQCGRPYDVGHELRAGDDGGMVLVCLPDSASA